MVDRALIGERPRIPYAPAGYSQTDLQRILSLIERRFQTLETVAAEGYTTSNVTTDRTIDADSTTLAEVVDVLCTLIEDLKNKGIIG